MTTEMDISGIEKRYARISTLIDVEKLERENMKFFYTGLAIGVYILFLTSYLISYMPPDFRSDATSTARRIPVDLITIPPQTETVADKEAQEFTRRTYREEISRHGAPEGKFEYKKLDLSLRGRVLSFQDIEEAVELALNMQLDFLDSLIYELETFRFDPEEYYKYKELTISRIPDDSYSDRDEFVSLETLDALGRYKGFIVRDPDDKMNLSGFVRVPMIAETTGIKAIFGLGEAFERYTALHVVVDDNFISLASDRLHDYPFLYISCYQAFMMNEAQRDNFAAYLHGGGFVFLDNYTPWYDFQPGEASIYLMLVDALGEDFDFRPLSDNHPVYYCFFDLQGSAPEGTENMFSERDNEWRTGWGSLRDNKQVLSLLEGINEKVRHQSYSLWGVWVDGRLAAIYADKGYGHIWNEDILADIYNRFYRGPGKYDFNPQLKMGMNILVYGLLQEGGIAQKVVDDSSSK